MKIEPFSIFFNLFQVFQIDKRKGLVSNELAASEESVGHEFTGSESHSLRIRHGFSFSSLLFFPLPCLRAQERRRDERPSQLSYGDCKTLIARAYSGTGDTLIYVWASSILGFCILRLGLGFSDLKLKQPIIFHHDSTWCDQSYFNYFFKILS